MNGVSACEHRDLVSDGKYHDIITIQLPDLKLPQQYSAEERTWREQVFNRKDKKNQYVLLNETLVSRYAWKKATGSESVTKACKKER